MEDMISSQRLQRDLLRQELYNLERAKQVENQG